MTKQQIKKASQLFIITFFILITIIGGIMTSLSILKEETINAKINIAKLQADNFAQNMSQTLNSAKLIFDTLDSTINLHSKNLNQALLEILENNPHIRSISFLNQKNQIRYSSNPKNIGLFFPVNNFYPIPLFNSPILRVGDLYMGRDIFEGVNAKEIKTLNKHESTFIPIAKQTHEHTLVLVLNPDYFINEFSSKLEPFAHVDILRLDNTLLTSSDSSMPLGKVLQDNPLLHKAKEHTTHQGITYINHIKSIVAYELTSNYPINIAVRIDYEKSLQAWESKRYEFFIITTSIVGVCVLLVLILLFMYNKRYEQELQQHQLQIQNQKKFKLLFENQHFLAAIVSPKGLIQDINQHALKFLHLPFSDVVKTTFWELPCFKEEDKQWLQNTLTNFQPNQEFYSEFEVLDSQKSVRIFDLMILTIDMQTHFELFIISSDITERKRYEYKIKEAYTVFENTHDGIIITDDQTKIINVNPAFELASGYSKHEVLGQTPNLFKSEIHDKNFYELFWKELLEHGSWEGEFINKKKNGELWTEWLMVNVVKNKKGEITNYIGIFHDTSKQKEQEKELKKKEELLYHQSKMAAMGEMIENIAHQWRQPLSVISSISTGLQVRNEIGDFNRNDVINDLKTINKTAQFLSKTIDDFRNFLRNDKTKHFFDVPQAVNKALDIVKSKLGNRNITVVQEMALIDINGFENELIQVLLNIINNAKDALEVSQESEKYIFIDAKEESNRVILTIKDNAGGIPETIIDKIFDPYFTTKHKSQGTGIGLYMSEQIICQHMKGELNVHNESYTYNQRTFTGACFTIILNK